MPHEIFSNIYTGKANDIFLCISDNCKNNTIIDLLQSTNRGKDSPLISLIKYRMNKIAEVVASLSEANKITLDHQNNHGLTALMVASQKGADGVINFLNRCGANLNLQDQDGNTALHFALQEGHQDAYNNLIIARARTDIPNNDGNTVEALFAGHNFPNPTNVIAMHQLINQIENLNVQDNPEHDILGEINEQVQDFAQLFN